MSSASLQKQYVTYPMNAMGSSGNSSRSCMIEQTAMQEVSAHAWTEKVPNAGIYVEETSRQAGNATASDFDRHGFFACCPEGTLNCCWRLWLGDLLDCHMLTRAPTGAVAVSFSLCHKPFLLEPHSTRDESAKPRACGCPLLCPLLLKLACSHWHGMTCH